MDPHHFGKPDPDPHWSEKPVTDPHLSQKQSPDPNLSQKRDPDPYQRQNFGVVRAQNGAMRDRGRSQWNRGKGSGETSGRRFESLL
jgi:hypothetical protein